MGKKERQIRARQLLDDFDLIPAADRKFAGYSKSMKRKLTIAAGIVHNPKILFLDEPTTGIDVAAARQLRRLISDLHRAGTTIYLTTHYIEEAQRLCDRVAFIVEGRIIRIEKVVDLLQPLQSRHVIQISCANQRKGMQDDLADSFPSCEFTIPMDNMIRVEAQTFSNFFRFPMMFLCGLFFPIAHLPIFLKPIAYLLPLTYGADVLHGAVRGGNVLPFYIDLSVLGLFCVALFLLSLRNIKRSWIV
jgi:energy-coupling factor transporter ATP-binding protein EcfA2